jgi:hypothetical protein
MLPRIEHLAFWLGGVVVSHMWELTRDTLIANGAECTPELCLALVDQEVVLTVGSITPEDFCTNAIELAGTELPSSCLKSQIQQRIGVMPGILPVIDALARRYPLHLVSDFPPRWLSVVLQSTALSTYFADDSIVMTSDLGLDNVYNAYNALPKALIDAGLLIPGKSLLVADDPILTESAIRSGLDAIIFVDASRLRRELVLLCLLAPETIT